LPLASTTAWILSSALRASAHASGCKEVPEAATSAFCEPLFDGSRHADAPGSMRSRPFAGLRRKPWTPLRKSCPRRRSPPSHDRFVAGRRRAIPLRMSARAICSEAANKCRSTLTVIRARYAPRLTRQQRRDDRPLKIRQFISASVHPNPPRILEIHLARQRNPLYAFVT